MAKVERIKDGGPTSQSTDLPLASDTTYADPFTGSLTGQTRTRPRGLYTLTEN